MGSFCGGEGRGVFSGVYGMLEYSSTWYRPTYKNLWYYLPYLYRITSLWANRFLIRSGLDHWSYSVSATIVWVNSCEKLSFSDVLVVPSKFFIKSPTGFGTKAFLMEMYWPEKRSLLILLVQQNLWQWHQHN